MNDERYVINSDGSVSTNEMPVGKKCHRHEDNLYVTMGPMQSTAYLDKRIDDLENKGSKKYGVALRIIDSGDDGVTYELLNVDGEVISTQTITPNERVSVDEGSGTLTHGQLATILAKKGTPILYDEHLYELNRISGRLLIYTTIKIEQTGETKRVSQIVVDSTTGAYAESTLDDKRIKDIEDDLRALHNTKVSATATFIEREAETRDENFMLNLLTD